ncbi:MAG TPA: hypothetical protein VJA40_02090 [archaeon]|nr:hypothetical protein [archaeon]
MLNRELVLTILLGVLVVVSAVQAYQLIGLSDKIATGEVAVSKLKAAGASAGSGGSSTLAQSLANLPTQVGGC